MELIEKYFPEMTSRQHEQMAALYDFYHEWNEKINVISRRDIDNIYLHHVLHSLAIARFIAFRPGTRILDLGTGGGFPGIPLAVMFPQCTFKLIDGTGKKIRVAQEACTALGLDNCRPEHLRGEEEKETFHYVVSRAVMPLPQLARMVKKNISREQLNAMPNGIICLKGGDLTEETKPFARIVQTTELTTYFSEPWFSDKYIVYLPA